MNSRRKIARPKLKRFYLNHGAYYFVDTRGRWHHLGRSYPHALQRYAELIDAQVAPKMHDIFERYRHEVIPAKAPLTQRDNALELANLDKAFGKAFPDEIEPTDIYAYMDARGGKTRANREKALLSHVYKYAIRWGFCKDNPCRLVENFKEKPRKRYVTDAEFWTVHDAAPAGIQKAMLLAVCTGLRLSDILALSPRACSADGLVVRPAKTSRSTAKVLLFPWTPSLLAILDWTQRSPVPATSQTFVVGARGKPFTRSGFQTVWQRLMRQVFPNKEDRFTFHDLRAKAGSDSADGKLLGHADLRTLEQALQT